MKSIENLYKEWLNLQPLKLDDRKRLDNKFMLEFNYNSNHLEGNTLTYGQTKLLFMFGKTAGNASIRDYEEMKAHNVGLELMRREALDKTRPLTEAFIRELNRIILVEDFKKPNKDGTGLYEIKVGVYKTRPNSVITATGEEFHYASPEETPAMMTELIHWYNKEENLNKLNPIELASLLHYRYIRIHPFEDGNGRIARLLINYVLLRHNYPLIIIKTEDKANYLNILNVCDIEVGLTPSDGANAQLEDIQPFVEYIKNQTEFSLNLSIKAAKGESIDEKGDWKKKLALKVKETEEAPLYSVELAKKANEESFVLLINQIDKELCPFYTFFDEAILINNYNNTVIKLENLPSILFTDRENSIRLFFRKILANKHIEIFFNIFIIFKNQYYTVLARFKDDASKQMSLDFKYGEVMDDDLAGEYITFLGTFLAEFVDEQLK
ncbi:MAG: Fic family protein [Bacteroidia bacterium]|nr:Fic family protein [Bacteroidia bacterium]